MTIEPLTTERFGDLALLFNEGGDPKWCWCMYFRTPGMSWSNSTAAGNAHGLKALTGKKLAPGLIAYRDTDAVGWVSLAPREDYGRLATATLLAPLDDTPVWSIVCFVVSRRARRSGVATALLSAAIDYARAHGATTLEGYPVATERGRVPAAEAYHGSQSMFERAGFAVAETRQWNRSSPIRPIMRLDLAALPADHSAR